MYAIKRLIFVLCMLPTFGLAQSIKPAVFVPGILGTKLCDKVTNVPVWGGTRSLNNFAKLDLEAGFALVPCGLVDKIDLLGPFWAIHNYDKLFDDLKELGYEPNKTLFSFPYDWRQSNIETAKLLRDFIDRNPTTQNGGFDLIVHSMGGLSALYYLHELGGASKVRRVVFLGTPFAGSMNALATLSDGWGIFANHLAGGIGAIRRVMLSMPAFYELLPRYEGCCRIGSETEYEAVNIFDYATWKKYNWLPDEYLEEDRAQRMQANLARAATFKSLVARETPNVRQVKIAGDAFATRYYLYASNANPDWHNWRFSKSRGDGTVPVWSAANDFLSLAGTIP